MFALITGGSQGIGRCIAEEFAKRKINVLIVALADASMEETATFLREKYSILVETFTTDLTKDSGAQEVYDFCQTKQITVQYLINNAGMGYTDSFSGKTIGFHETLLKLNILANVRLCHLFLEDMKKLPKAYIMNVSSMAGLFTMPFKSTYAASKQFIVNFSEALREEVRFTSVSVSVLFPTGVATNPETTTAVEKLGKIGKYVSSTPQIIAAAGVKGLLAGKKRIIADFWSRLFATTRHIVPKDVVIWLVGKVLRKKFQQ